MTEQEEIIEILKKYDKDTLLVIQSQLNSWKWPEQLISYKPDWWTDIGNDMLMQRKYLYGRSIFTYLQSVISHHDMLKYHQTVHLKICTEEEFEIWWEQENQEPMTNVESSILGLMFRNGGSIDNNQMKTHIIDQVLKETSQQN